MQTRPATLSSCAPPSSPAPVRPQTGCTPDRTVPSDDLLRGRRSVDISHNGSVYRLQATRLGKLILTK